MAQNQKIIDGALFYKMVLGGAANLHANLKTVNDLNVFPIPDGDTGENMYLTMQGGLDCLQKSGDSLEEKAQSMAQGMLLGARGNSGVILSQLFFGLSEGMKGLQEATVEQFAQALNEGVRCAYGAVAHPVEGTILTVAREATENMLEKSKRATVEDFFAEFLQEMKKSLERTPDLLAVLKESGVIDSGGAGLVYIMEGFCKALGGEKIEGDGLSPAQKTVDFSKFTENDVMQFGYCTEVLLRLQTCKTDVDAFSVQELIEYLSSVGDSVVAFQTGTIVKIHVHTMTPYKVLEYCQTFGEYLTVKIENMTLQHNESVVEEKTQLKMPKRARRKYATVTVASGEGLKDVFLEMGVDYVISGGQTNNPSSEAFIEAFERVNADVIFVLPNNGNIVLAAKQAANIYQDSDVRVIESKTVGQGYSALSMLDYSADDPDKIQAILTESMQGTETATVARAVRTTTCGGVEVRKDEYMGFTDHTMYVCTPAKIQTACELLQSLRLDEKEFLIAVYGKYTTAEEREEFRSKQAEEFPNVELYEIDGGQDVYDFLFIIE